MIESNATFHRIKKIIKDSHFGKIQDNREMYADKIFQVFYHINNNFDDLFYIGQEKSSIIEKSAARLKDTLWKHAKDIRSGRTQQKVLQAMMEIETFQSSIEKNKQEIFNLLATKTCEDTSIYILDFLSF